MRYVDWLHGFIGSEAEVTVSGDVIVGTLAEVGNGTLTLEVPLSSTARQPIRQSSRFVRLNSFVSFPHNHKQLVKYEHEKGPKASLSVLLVY